MLYLLALLVGILAGLRAMLAPAAVAWSARLGWLALHDSWLAFLGYRWTPWILSVAALAEIVNDKLPGTPSRKVPPQFGARLFSGGLCGAAVGLPHGAWIVGLVLGVVGAVIGTLGGSAVRGALARSFGNDAPAALVEDGAAILIALFLVHAL